jgi:hypothetical protein
LRERNETRDLASERTRAAQAETLTPSHSIAACVPPSRTPTDHRGTMTVSINRGDFDNGQVKIEKLADTKLPREDRWLGL